MKISIIGYGNMAKALCQGLLQHSTYEIQVAAPSLGIAQPEPRLSTHFENNAILSDAHAVILAVKPNHMASVLTEIQSHLSPASLVISVAAGLNLEWFNQHLPAKTPLVRAIPNLAAAHGQSATPLFANQWITATQKTLVTDLFQLCGQIAWVAHEQDLDSITALSGSGLAYLFLFVQAMCDGAIRLGLPKETATTFAVQTLIGAASLASVPQQTLLGLQQQVASKAGTTAAALEVFAQHELSETVLTAMRAAVTRSQNLRKEE